MISVKELKYFMRKVAHIKLSNEEAEAMIKYADTDNDGYVTFNDFKTIAVELSEHFANLKIKTQKH